MDETELLLLEMLADAPSSVAALFSSARLGSDVDPDGVQDALLALEERAYVDAFQVLGDGSCRPPRTADRARARAEYRAWLPAASIEDTVIDETGLWYQITGSGREALEGLREPPQREPCGVVDEHAERGVVEVRAVDTGTAEALLRQYLRAVHGTSPASGRSSVAPLTFVVPDRAAPVDGVLLTYLLEDERSV